jgi:hypothetical protein
LPHGRDDLGERVGDVDDPQVSARSPADGSTWFIIATSTAL